MAVLKDNAYGHGLLHIARLVCEYGIRRVAVKNFEEAKAVAHLFDEVLVLVDHPLLEDYPSNISFAVHSMESLSALAKHKAIHLSIDTGMHRNGIKQHQIAEAMSIISKKELVLKGVFTHFRSADELSAELFWQKSNFEAVKKEIKKYGIEGVAFHSHNSAALLRADGIGDDAYARSGIAIYGYNPLDTAISTLELKPVLSLWAEKLSSRVLKKGQRVGYGGMYEATEDEVISTYDIGYGDGFFRFDGIKRVAMADGSLSIGRMSMDSFSLKGDSQKVCIFNDARVLAKEFSTICYEITTKLSPSIKRVVV